MTTRSDIVREARSWVGTAYRHQQHAKGRATDCVGLVYGVGFNLGLLPSELPQLRGYGKQATDGIIERVCDELLVRIPLQDMQPGDVFVNTFGGGFQHVGILGDRSGLSVIHAWAPLRKVVEARLDAATRQRIVAVFAYPGVKA